MYKIFPDTLFVGRDVRCLPHCHSTNTEAAGLIRSGDFFEGTVVITPRQTAGRGQRGNTWESEEGKNLTFSVILRPSFLRLDQQFYLNIAVSLSVINTLSQYGAAFKIKWPNDIYYGDKKLGGILIESNIKGNTLDTAVAGIGLNINQLHFSEPRAVSLAQILHRETDASALLQLFLEQLEAHYLVLKQGGMESLKTNYLQHLYRYQEIHAFRVGDEVVEGMILGIDASGRLALSTGAEVQYFNFKEIAFIN